MKLIDAEQMEKHIMESKVFTQYFKELVQALIWGEDAVDAVPVVRGEWLNFTGDFSTTECSKCGELCEVTPDEKPCEEFFNVFKQFYQYCPNCGAKMDKEAQHADE